MLAILPEQPTTSQWCPPKPTVLSSLEASFVGLLAGTLSGSPGSARRIECFGLQSAVNDGVSDINETLIVVESVMAKPREGLLHVEPGPLRYDTFGLLYDDVTVEGMIELLVHELGLAGGPVVKDGDGGHVGQSLGGHDVTLFHGTLVGSEKAQGTDGDAA